MKRILVVTLFTLVLCGCSDKKEEVHLTMIATDGGEGELLIEMGRM